MVHMSKTGKQAGLFPPETLERPVKRLLHSRSRKKVAFLEPVTRNRGSLQFNLMLEKHLIRREGIS